MSAYVRVRKLDDLRRAIDAAGTQTDVAAAAHFSVQRLNQLALGRHDVLEVRKAARLEQVLNVPPGTLFDAIDGDLLRPYIGDSSEHDSGTEDPTDDEDDAPSRHAAAGAAPAA